MGVPVSEPIPYLHAQLYDCNNSVQIICMGRKRKRDREKEGKGLKERKEEGRRTESREDKKERRDGRVGDERGSWEEARLAYSKYTYRDWVVDDRILQEPHH